MEKQREDWVDAIKGFAIIGTIVGHMILFFCSYGGSFSFICFLIYAFHMPLFFFMSGYLYKKCDENKVIFTILEKTLNLLVPAMILGIGLLFLYGVEEIVKNKNGFNVFSVITSSINTDWFLLVLWFVSILMMIISLKKINLVKLFIICFSDIFIFYPISIFCSRLALYFSAYILGMLFKDGILNLSKKYIIVSTIIFVPMSIIIFLISKSSEIANPIYKGILSLLIGSVLLYWFKTKRIGMNRFLGFCGKNSLEIYILHIWGYIWMITHKEFFDNRLIPEIMVVISSGLTIGMISIFILIFRKYRFMCFIKKPSKFLLNNIKKGQ